METIACFPVTSVDPGLTLDYLLHTDVQNIPLDFVLVSGETEVWFNSTVLAHASQKVFRLLLQNSAERRMEVKCSPAALEFLGTYDAELTDANIVDVIKMAVELEIDSLFEAACCTEFFMGLEKKMRWELIKSSAVHGFRVSHLLTPLKDVILADEGFTGEVFYPLAKEMVKYCVLSKDEVLCLSGRFGGRFDANVIASFDNEELVDTMKKTENMNQVRDVLRKFAKEKQDSDPVTKYNYKIEYNPESPFDGISRSLVVPRKTGPGVMEFTGNAVVMVTGYSIRGESVAEWQLTGDGCFDAEKETTEYGCKIIDSQPAKRARYVNTYIAIPRDKWSWYQKITLESAGKCEYEIFGYVLYKKAVNDSGDDELEVVQEANEVVAEAPPQVDEGGMNDEASALAAAEMVQNLLEMQQILQSWDQDV